MRYLLVCCESPRHCHQGCSSRSRFGSCGLSSVPSVSLVIAFANVPNTTPKANQKASFAWARSTIVSKVIVMTVNNTPKMIAIGRICLNFEQKISDAVLIADANRCAAISRLEMTTTHSNPMNPMLKTREATTIAIATDHPKAPKGVLLATTSNKPTGVGVTVGLAMTSECSGMGYFMHGVPGF